ncbi:hypothetical protein AYO38_04105 [bacterium SCGC AG-212-C10]|nr:hypothetical protein AYO38_04105 [bacterium SCGC AG-212-C10]
MFMLAPWPGLEPAELANTAPRSNATHVIEMSKKSRRLPSPASSETCAAIQERQAQIEELRAR